MLIFNRGVVTSLMDVVLNEMLFVIELVRLTPNGIVIHDQSAYKLGLCDNVLMYTSGHHRIVSKTAKFKLSCYFVLSD